MTALRVCLQSFEIQRLLHKVNGTELVTDIFKTQFFPYQNELWSERVAAKNPQQVYSSQPRHTCFRNDHRRLEAGNSFQRFDCVGGYLVAHRVSTSVRNSLDCASSSTKSTRMDISPSRHSPRLLHQARSSKGARTSSRLFGLVLCATDDH